MDSNLIVLTDQDGNSVRFELLDIVEYKEDEYAVLYPADGGDDEPVHILRIISENLDVNEAEFEGLDDDELIDTIYQIFRDAQRSGRLILPRKRAAFYLSHVGKMLLFLYSNFSSFFEYFSNIAASGENISF